MNFQDETQSVRGTPVNRKRLMGMQGFLSCNTQIVTISDTHTRITETGEEGTTTTDVEETPTGSIAITERFVAANGQTIVKTTRISEIGGGMSVTEMVSG